MELALTALEEKLFTVDFIKNAIQLLISKYLVLSQDDLSSWTEDPESFFLEEEADHWEYHIRSCAEKLFMVLVSKHRNVVTPLLITSLAIAAEPTDIRSMLFRDSLYCAIGLGAYDLFEYLNFDDFVLRKLLAEAQTVSPDLAVLRRRVSWVIGKWVGVKASPQIRPTIYQILLGLLAPNQDLVVRLTSVTSLKIALDDFDFVTEQYHPYVATTLELLIRLLQDVDEFDCKMCVLQCLIVLIDRLDGYASPFVAPILDAIPALWVRSEGQNMFRTSIVSIMTRLVTVFVIIKLGT